MTAGALLDTLRDRFGFCDFRPGQEPAIGHILGGRDTLVVMPTGSGKSLIYQLAALHLPGFTVVISPLIALMKDQVDSLTRHGVPAAFINSALAPQEQALRLTAARANEFRLLYVAPERLRSQTFLDALQHCQISLLAVDEAHCISHWGHDFRPDYLHIAAFRQAVGNPVVAALTATATPQVQEDIVRQLGVSANARVVTGFNRPNLTFEVCCTPDEQSKLEMLGRRLSVPGDGAAIVYVGVRRDAELVAEFVRDVVGREVASYHAGMPTDQRTAVQDAFMHGQLTVVAATNAFGMGVDRPDVRLVLHFSLPGTLEAYYQEAGRAGRDGRPAEAVLLYRPDDRALQEFFIKNDAPTTDERRALFQVLRSCGEAIVQVSLAELSYRTGLYETKIRVGLSDLEGAGAILRLGDVGQRLCIQVCEWDEERVSKVASSVMQRRRNKLSQLNRMIWYAESNDCRRRILLDYFGDGGPADAPRCCDNCLVAAAPIEATPGELLPTAELAAEARIGLAILDAVRRLDFPLGRDKLAQVLRGSRSSQILERRLNQHIYHGRLSDFQQGQIRDMVDQLCRAGYLKMVGGDRPVMRLTPLGLRAIEAKAHVPLDLPHPPSSVRVERRRREREAGGTIELTGRMFEQGMTPEAIAAERGLSRSTILGHLAVLIGDGKAPLSAVVSADMVSQVFEAIRRSGQVAKLAPIKQHLPDSIPWDEIRCAVEGWKWETRQPDIQGKAPPSSDPRSGPSGQPGAAGPARADQEHLGDAVAAFLSRSHPRELSGPWDIGWALDFHSAFDGTTWTRSPIGELAYRLKYLEDESALDPLVAQIERLADEVPELRDVSALVPVPSSTGRKSAPAALVADRLAQSWGLPALDAVQMARQTAPQKEMNTQSQKRANVQGAFRVCRPVRGLKLLVLDDLCDSGATLQEVCRVLKRAGAAGLCVLTLTRTIHSAD